MLEGRPPSVESNGPDRAGPSKCLGACPVVLHLSFVAPPSMRPVRSNARERPAAGALPHSDGCKPDSVQPAACAGAWTAICLAPRVAGGAALAGCDYYPEVPRRLAPRVRAGNPVPPVLSCTAWGFSCPRTCARGGGLLPRLFTLATRLAPGGGLFSLTLSVGTGFRPYPPRVLRGMLPSGVRTFLSPPALRPAENGRPPSQGSYASRARNSSPEERAFSSRWGIGVFIPDPAVLHGWLRRPFRRAILR